MASSCWRRRARRPPKLDAAAASIEGKDSIIVRTVLALWASFRPFAPKLNLCADCGIESLLSLDSDGVGGGPAARSAEQPRV
jgi:hypothetical protein